jgi:flagellar motor switch protein FliN
VTALPLAPNTDHLALAAGEAAAAALPASEVLTAGAPQPGDPQVGTLFAGAVVAALGGGANGALAVLVADELVRAIDESPIEGLDLHAAVQPALDAAAAALGGSAQVGRAVNPVEVPSLLGGAFSIVPLAGNSGVAAALLVAVTPSAGAPQAAFPAPAATMPAPGMPVVGATGSSRGLEMLHGVAMEVTVELGRTRMTVRELLALAPGQVLELDRAAGSPADLLVNGRLIARGEVVVVDEDFGLRVTEIVDESAAN